jgi:hypothetical protein
LIRPHSSHDSPVICSLFRFPVPIEMVALLTVFNNRITDGAMSAFKM